MTHRHAAAVTLLLSIVTLGAQGPAPAPAGEWRAYHGDNRSLRYSPLDQITRANVATLRLAWERDLGPIGPKPEFKNEAAPLYVDGTLFMTAGINRDVVALDPATGAEKWRWTLDEGERTARAPRRNSGRGVQLLARRRRRPHRRRHPGLPPGVARRRAPAGRSRRSAATAWSISSATSAAGDFDPLAPIGSSSPVVIANGVIVVGPALELGFRPRTMANVPGYIRGFDVRTGKELWRFNTIPQAGEKYLDTWEGDSWKYTGNAGVWAPFSADEALGYVYLPVEAPTGDLYGGHRLGDNVYSSSLVCLDVRTGRVVWHFQQIHHDIWDYDNTTAPMLIDVQHWRPHRQGGRAGDQAGLHLRVRPRHRAAAVADRRAAGAGQRRAGRAERRDPAVSDRSRRRSTGRA